MMQIAQLYSFATPITANLSWYQAYTSVAQLERPTLLAETSICKTETMRKQTLSFTAEAELKVRSFVPLRRV
jgi:hypothetical protein